MKNIILPPLRFLSNLTGFWKPENCSQGKVSISVSDNKRTSILFVIKGVSISNLFLIESIFNCPINNSVWVLKPWISVSIFTTFLFVSLKEKVDLSGWFLLHWFNFWKLLFRINRCDVILVSRVSYITKLRSYFPYYSFKIMR